MNEMTRVTRPGGTVAVSDLDGNCVWHYPVEETLETDIVEAVNDLRPTGFDPYVGRRLFSIAKAAGLQEIKVNVTPYHVFAGRIDDENLDLWDLKLKTIGLTLQSSGWSPGRVDRLRKNFGIIS